MKLKCDKEAKELLVTIGDTILKCLGIQGVKLFNALEGVIPKDEDLIVPKKPKDK